MLKREEAFCTQGWGKTPSCKGSRKPFLQAKYYHFATITTFITKFTTITTFAWYELVAKKLNYVMVFSVGVKLCSVECERLSRLGEAYLTYLPYCPENASWWDLFRLKEVIGR